MTEISIKQISKKHQKRNSKAQILEIKVFENWSLFEICEL